MTDHALLDPAEIVAYLEASSVILSEAPRAKSKDLQTLPAENEVDPMLPGYGKKVLITAGRTEEAIDPVR